MTRGSARHEGPSLHIKRHEGQYRDEGQHGTRAIIAYKEARGPGQRVTRGSARHEGHQYFERGTRANTESDTRVSTARGPSFHIKRHEGQYRDEGQHGTRAIIAYKEARGPVQRVT